MDADAWAIHYSAGLRTCTFDAGRAPLIASQLRGTLHPMVYAEKLMTLDIRSERNLEGVHPKLIAVTRRAHELALEADDGFDFIVTAGLRTEEQQAKLVKAGASRTMDSKHRAQADGMSHANDLAARVDRAVQWDWPLYYRIAGYVRQAAIEQGVQVVWGGVWDRLLNDLKGELDDDVADYVKRRKEAGLKAFIDGPHFHLADQVHSA